MSQTKKSTKRAARARRRGAPDALPTITSSKTRMKSLFRLLADVTGCSDRALAAATHPQREPEKHLFRFDVAVLMRGLNALKSVGLLCEEAHWESASGILRQLFELVVNMEHLGELPDREAAVLRYANYGLMQQIEFKLSHARYGQVTGRDVPSDYVESLERMLAETFPEFRPVVDGKLRKQPSWSGHNVSYLATKSSNSMRKNQYDMLFRMWSEQMHGAPAALLDDMVATRSVSKIIAEEDVRIAETMTMALSLFVELWMLLPHAPTPEAEHLVRWTAQVGDEARRRSTPGNSGE